MAGENEEGAVEMTGADDGMNLNETVDTLVESLNLATGDEGQAGEEDKGAQGETQAEDGTAAAAPATDATQQAGDGKPAAAEAGVQTGAPTADERVPDTWRPEAKEKWAAIDPVVRAEIAKREGDVARFVAEAKPSFQLAQELNKTVQPYLPLMQKYGLRPLEHIGALLNAHTTLLFGQPEVKAQMFRNLAQQAGIDLSALAADPNSSAQANTQQLAYIRGLEERLARMEEGVTGVTSTIQEARTAELEQGIMAFAGDTENNPFFWELANSGEIKALIDNGAARTLKDAYELALWRNPVTRAKQLALDTKKAGDAQRARNAEKATAARKATSAGVKSRASGRLPPAEESIDETLRNTLSDIHSRATH